MFNIASNERTAVCRPTFRKGSCEGVKGSRSFSYAQRFWIVSSSRFTLLLIVPDSHLAFSSLSLEIPGNFRSLTAAKSEQLKFLVNDMFTLSDLLRTYIS